MKLYHINWGKLQHLSKDAFMSLISPMPQIGDELSQGDNIFDNAKLAFDNSCYELVAEVEIGDLNFAYRYTQHIDSYWNEHPQEGIKPAGEGPYRDTSVGDLIERDGIFHIVSPIGFKILNDFGNQAPTIKP